MAALEGFEPDEIRQTVASNPGDPLAHFRHGCLLAIEGQWMEALDELLESVKIDKSAGDEAARKTLLGIFAMLGENQPVVADYRRRLGQLLF